MLIKTFQAVLVTFVAVFTVVGAILLISAVVPLLIPSGSWAFSSGASARAFDVSLVVVLLIAVAAVFLFIRRHRLR